MKNKDLPPHLRRCSPSQKGTLLDRFEYLQDTMKQIPENHKQTFIKMYYREQGLRLINHEILTRKSIP